MIEVLKQALEALEIYWSKAEHRRTREDERQAESAIASLRQAIAGLESQAPIGRFTGKFWTDDAHNRMLCEIVCDVLPTAGEPLYTHPPQRKPLTSREIRSIEVEVAMSNSFAHPTKAEEFVRAIEAAHGIKGDA